MISRCFVYRYALGQPINVNDAAHMKIIYDADADILQISFTQHAVEETTQIAPGLVLDYDEDGQVVGIELRKASQRVSDPYRIDYSVGQASLDKPQPRVGEQH